MLSILKIVAFYLWKIKRLFGFYRTNWYIVTKLSKCQCHLAQICNLQCFSANLHCLLYNIHSCELRQIPSTGSSIYAHFCTFSLICSLHVCIRMCWCAVYIVLLANEPIHKQFKHYQINQFCLRFEITFYLHKFCRRKIEWKSWHFLDRIQAKLSIFQKYCRLIDSHFEILDLL